MQAQPLPGAVLVSCSAGPGGRPPCPWYKLLCSSACHVACIGLGTKGLEWERGQAVTARLPGDAQP